MEGRDVLCQDTVVPFGPSHPGPWRGNESARPCPYLIDFNYCLCLCLLWLKVCFPRAEGERRDSPLSFPPRNRFPSVFRRRTHHHLSEDVGCCHCLCLLWLKVCFSLVDS